jgi:hypothetical protein
VVHDGALTGQGESTAVAQLAELLTVPKLLSNAITETPHLRQAQPNMQKQSPGVGYNLPDNPVKCIEALTLTVPG